MVIKVFYVNLLYIVLICLIFGFIWLVEIVVVLVIGFLIFVGIFFVIWVVFCFLF